MDEESEESEESEEYNQLGSLEESSFEAGGKQARSVGGWCT